MTLTCLNCPRVRAAGQLLCPPCWRALTPAARRALKRRDGQGLARVRSLTAQIRDRRPLGQIEISE